MTARLAAAVLTRAINRIRKKTHFSHGWTPMDTDNCFVDLCSSVFICGQPFFSTLLRIGVESRKCNAPHRRDCASGGITT